MYILYACHHNPLWIIIRSEILTRHKKNLKRTSMKTKKRSTIFDDFRPPKYHVQTFLLGIYFLGGHFELALSECNFTPLC